LALCLVLVAGRTEAVFVSGNQLLAHCREYKSIAADHEGSSFEAGHCGGFLHGVADSYQSLHRLDASSPPLYCMPAGVSGGQLVRIVFKFLEANPEKLNAVASDLVLLAYVEAFPCP